MDIIQEIKNFVPLCPQEQRDKAGILRFLAGNPDAFERENLTAHMTASAWVLSPDRRQVVMVYHNIYNSWSWTGGHADGDRDLLAVAMREVTEETGLQRLELLHPGIFSLECLTVDGHEKRGQYVPSHIHMNVTYLLGAMDHELRQKPDENSGVAWFTPEEALKASTVDGPAGIQQADPAGRGLYGPVRRHFSWQNESRTLARSIFPQDSGSAWSRWAAAP